MPPAGRADGEQQSLPGVDRAEDHTQACLFLRAREHVPCLLRCAPRFKVPNWKLARHAGCPGDVCVALLGIDFFKVINDKYGHAGGDELLLPMPDTPLDAALAESGRIATRLTQLRIDAVGPRLAITFSAGVAACRPFERFDEAICRADAAMYRAKVNGRNCVLAA